MKPGPWRTPSATGCTRISGVRPEQLSGPLSAFQATEATHDDTLQLVSALQRAALPTFDEAALNARFESAWPALDTVLRGLEAVTIEAVFPGFVELFKVKTFTEPMRECPDLGWIARHERLARVDAVLEKRRNEVAALGRPHLLYLYDELRRQLDLYQMNISAQLLTAKTFGKARDGLLDVPNDILDGCELPRLRVREIVERLLDASGAPVLQEALRFDALDTNQRKAVVQGLERRLANKQTVLPRARRGAALDSRWDFDRIACYLSLEVEASTVGEVQDLIEQVRRELELVETKRLPARLMPLYYALRAVASTTRRIASVGDDVRHAALRIVADVERYVTADPARDERGRFAERLAEIRRTLAAG